MAEEIFDGFDPSQYADEVIEHWGRDAYEKANGWWHSLSDTEKQAFQQEHLDIARDFAEARAAGKAAGSDDVQAIAARHHAWVQRGTIGPAGKCYYTGLGRMYADDPRFTETYDRHGEGTAEFIRDAVTIYAANNLAE